MAMKLLNGIEKGFGYQAIEENVVSIKTLGHVDSPGKVALLPTPWTAKPYIKRRGNGTLRNCKDLAGGCGTNENEIMHLKSR